MLKGRRGWLVLGALAAALVVAAGAGVAATGGDGDGFLADVARRLGITEQKLTDAIRDARLAQVDEAVAAGDLTEEQGERLKERIRSGEAPGLRAGPGPRGFGFGLRGPFGRARGPGVLEAAADYLGLTRAELGESLREEGTLAAVARAQGKAVDGLKAAVRKAIESHLEEAVEDGRLSEADSRRVREDLAQTVDRIVESGFRPRGHRHGGPFGSWHGSGERPADPDASFGAAA